MFLSRQFLSLNILSGIWGAAAFPNPNPEQSSYAVKERHAVPRSWTATSRPSDKSDIISLHLGLKQRNEGIIERHLIEVSDPTHDRYGDHLTAAEVNNIVSPSDETIDLVHTWLLGHDISESGISYSPARDWISISIPIEKAEELLQTSYSTFKHHDGSTILRTTEWSLPRYLHEHIDVVQPTTSFFRLTAEVEAWGPKVDAQSYGEPTSKHWYDSKPESSSGSIDTICNITFTTVDCLRTLYGTIDYAPKAAGKNKLGITNYLNQSNNRPDIRKFLQTFRPEAVAAADEFEIINIANAGDFQGPNLTAQQVVDQVNIEGDLDAMLTLGIVWPTPLISWLTGGSPPFTPDVHTPTNNNEPYLTWLNYVLAQDNLPQVISTSYGDDEQTVPLSYAKRACSGLAQLGARGISVLFSSGDFGVGANGTCVSNTDSKAMFIPTFPASCPWVTSVGATQGFKPEVTIQRFGSGAGFSNYFASPSYQKKTVEGYIKSLGGLYDGLYNKSGRGFPDVAAQGNHDAIVWGGNVRTVGGTSSASPTFASVISLVNDALIAKGKKPLGFLNPWIYGGAYRALTDITSGSSIGCNTSGFPAQKGWDAATGWGSPNFSKLVAAAFEKH